MPVSPARVAAFEILMRVEQKDAYASELLHSSRYARLSSPDHGLATELVMGSLRWQSLLDQEIAKCSSLKLQKLDPEVLISLRIAAYQLMFSDRVPERAAIHESVELVKRARKRSAATFANAVLRKLAASKPRSPLASLTGTSKTALDLARNSSHPDWLVERWIREFGFEAAQKICEYDQHVPETAVSIRDPGIEGELKTQGVTLEPGRLLATARRVVAGDLTRTRSFHEGLVAVQDEASQLIALLVGEGANILDCCAAPGGKTRVLAEQNPSASIIAVDIHPHRARLLRKLAPAENVRVIVADTRELPISAVFDRVLADVPCSGTGTLARNPEIKFRLKPKDLLDLQVRQVAILQSAMRRVAIGGKLVYSTCSLEKEENAEVVEQALLTDRSFRVLDCRAQLEHMRTRGELVWKDVGSLTKGLYLRTIPGVHPCDGFFAAVLEKT